MFVIERSVLPPRSRPRTSDVPASDGGAVPGTIARTPPVPATFLERAAGGAFELFPRRHFAGAGAVTQATLPGSVLADLLPGRPESGDPDSRGAWRATAPLPPVTPPQAPRLRRSA